MSDGKAALQGAFGRVALLDIDRQVVSHAHPQCHVLIKVGGADSTFRVKDRDYPLAEGTAVLVNSWEPHAYPHTPAAPRSTVLALYVNPAWLSGIERGFAASAAAGFFARPCVSLTSGVRRRAYEMAEALLAGAEADGPPLALLAALMNANVEDFSEWRRLPAVDRRSVPDFRVRRAIRFLENNLGRDFTLADVARAAGLSRPHLFEVFRRNTGVTPQLYYNALRMEAAYSALPGAGETIAGLSASLGFAAPGAFTRFFRNNLGIAPRDYRRSLRETGLLG